MSVFGRIWPIALVAYLYVATWPFHQGLNNPNEMVRVYMTKAMVDHDTVTINPVLREWGGVDDKAIRDNRLYSSKAPLQSIVGVPVYIALKLVTDRPTKRTITTVLRIFCSALFGIIFAYLLLAWSRRRAQELGTPPAQGTAIALVLALGSMLYPFAITFTGHLLAAFTSVGCFLALVYAAREQPGSRRWRIFLLLAGFASGATPFAEYPAALAALPASIAALFMSPKGRRLETLLLLAAGGLLPFLLGLYFHDALWGSPFKTGYSFLENQAYVQQHHKEGFFGVSQPRPEAFFGSLFHPATGLFFYTPMLLLGLGTLIYLTIKREAQSAIPRSLIVAAAVIVLLQIAFISSHMGWRGGWTIAGPRYIISIVPLLGLFVVEGLRFRGVRLLIAPLGAWSIVATAFGAALYPHFSDVYTNPLLTFLYPSYARGEMSYGFGHTLGLERTAANLLHLIPIFIALFYVMLHDRLRLWVMSLRSAAAIGALVLLVALIPEPNPAAAVKENARLWGFWEPRAKAPKLPGLLFYGRDRWRSFKVEFQNAEGKTRRCLRRADHCKYGPQPWQVFKPDVQAVDGEHRLLLSMHPIQTGTVRATLRPPKRARRAILRYGLTDAAVVSDNPNPVELRLLVGGREVTKLQASNRRGLQSYEFELRGSEPVTLEEWAKADGARVFLFDLEIYER